MNKRKSGTPLQHGADARTMKDMRSLGGRLLELALQKHVLVPGLTGLAVVCLAAPSLSIVAGASAACLAAMGLSRRLVQPINIPIQANHERPCPDPHDPDYDGKPRPASGIFYLGTDTPTGKEVWLANDDCRQHFLVLGEPGSRKDELLAGFGANALNWSSGFMLIQAKDDAATFARIFALARFYGREDDVLVINCMGDDHLGGATNTMNPFSTGSSESMTQMIVSLMDDVGSDGAMWRGRAVAMLSGVMRALCYLQAEGVIELNVREIRDHLSLNLIIDLADEMQYPELSPAARHTIKSYLASLPGFQTEKGYMQAQTTLDHHGYLVIQIQKSLDQLATAFGHVFAAGRCDVDMYDVVINRRILVVLLPRMVSPDARTGTPGKLILSTLKRTMGMSLDDRVEGDYGQILIRVTNSSSPFVAICDDIGSYCINGLDLMAAQARGHGFSMTYGAESISDMKKLNDRVVGSIIGNTNTKIIMRIKDRETAKMAIELTGKAFRPTIPYGYPKPTVAADTSGTKKLDDRCGGSIFAVNGMKIAMRPLDPEAAKMATELAGKACRPSVGGFTGQSGEAAMSYADNLEARVEEVDRIGRHDLKEQADGQMYVVHRDQLLNVQGFTPNPAAVKDRGDLHPRVNEFVHIALPTAEDIKLWQLEVEENLRRLIESLER